MVLRCLNANISVYEQYRVNSHDLDERDTKCSSSLILECSHWETLRMWYRAPMCRKYCKKSSLHLHELAPNVILKQNPQLMNNTSVCIAW